MGGRGSAGGLRMSPFEYNGKSYRLVSKDVHCINDLKYQQFEFEHKGKWHPVRNASMNGDLMKYNNKRKN